MDGQLSERVSAGRLLVPVSLYIGIVLRKTSKDVNPHEDDYILSTSLVLCET